MAAASARTPTRLGGARSATTTASTPRRATPKSKLHLNFSAARAATPRSARKPLRVVADVNRTDEVDGSKILNGVYAMVDVRLGADAEIDCSDAVAKKLADMGATIMKKKSGRLTHVVVSHFTPHWKEKVAKWHSISTPVEVVSQLWVNACFTNKQRMKESAFFPVNKCFEASATTPTRRAIGNNGMRVVRQVSIKESVVSTRKNQVAATPMKSSLPVSMASSSARSVFATPQGLNRGTGSSTPTGRAGAANARKRRALSMEPMASDAILRLLDSSTKKLLRQQSESNVSAARIASNVEDLVSSPVKISTRDSKISTPPLTVRLRATIERRKSILSSSSAPLDMFHSHQAKSRPRTGDCVSESNSDDEKGQCGSDDFGGCKTITTGGAVRSTAVPTSQASLSLNILSPAVTTKDEWSCSICSCSNAKTRRLCKGCKASRVAATTCATETTPARRQAQRAMSATPCRPTSSSKVALPSDSTALASSTPAQKTPQSVKTTTKVAKRRRLSISVDTVNGGSIDIHGDESIRPATPSAKRAKMTPSKVIKKALPQRAVIGITGVDSETRGIIECAVHGIDANMTGEAGYRKARVVKSVDYAAGITHLIVGREVKRTIKVLFAIARGAWIVSEAWAFTSLEKERWLNEEVFEISAFPSRASRIDPEQRHVFRDLKFFVGSKMDPSREVLISLIQCAGGEIVNQISVADYCICGDETLFRRANRTRIFGVTPKWVFDSIANLKLEDPLLYSLNHIVSEGTQSSC